MPRDIELVKQELESSTTSIFITKWILEHTPYVFEDYETEYISWRHEIAEKLRIDARDIIITGSASLGFSLNPNKNFKSFDKKSDIDISIRKSDDDKKSDNTNIVLYASGIRNSSDLNARKNRYSALKSELGF